MKIVKAIKLHRKLRIEQEFYSNEIVEWSQTRTTTNDEMLDNLHNLSIYNRAVKKVEKKLPYIYFLLSDMFGGSYSLKQLSNNRKKK